MLGSFASPTFRQAGYQHYLPLGKQHKVIRDVAWRNNPYQLYGLLGIAGLEPDRDWETSKHRLIIS